MSLGHRWLSLFVTALLLLGGTSACQKRAQRDQETDSAAPKASALPPLAVRPDTANLLLTWIDDKGDFHVVDKPVDVPNEAKQTVRVVVTDKEAGTGDQVYVANLNETTPEGSYRVTTMSRAAWDELGAGRRKARLEALAPSSATAPSPSAPASAAAPDVDAKGVVVIVYGADWCKPCHDAEAYLRKRGVKVVKKDIEENQAAASEMKRKLERAGMGGASIPVIDVMGRILIGFSPSALDRAVEAARGTKL